jgi:hypothetical protein
MWVRLFPLKVRDFGVCNSLSSSRDPTTRVHWNRLIMSWVGGMFWVSTFHALYGQLSKMMPQSSRSILIAVEVHWHALLEMRTDRITIKTVIMSLVMSQQDFRRSPGTLPRNKCRWFRTWRVYLSRTRSMSSIVEEDIRTKLWHLSCVTTDSEFNFLWRSPTMSSSIYWCLLLKKEKGSFGGINVTNLEELIKSAVEHQARMQLSCWWYHYLNLFLAEIHLAWRPYPVVGVKYFD